jgi:hypothetical protein
MQTSNREICRVQAHEPRDLPSDSALALEPNCLGISTTTHPRSMDWLPMVHLEDLCTHLVTSRSPVSTMPRLLVSPGQENPAPRGKVFICTAIPRSLFDDSFVINHPPLHTSSSRVCARVDYRSQSIRFSSSRETSYAREDVAASDDDIMPPLAGGNTDCAGGTNG